MHCRHFPKAIFLLFAAMAWGQQPGQGSAQPTAGRGPEQQPGQGSGQPAQRGPAPVFVVSDIGKGVVPIGGLWQFHTGDDPRWAEPQWDDSGWDAIRTDATWGEQGYPSYTGFAWYRRHIEIDPTAGENSQLSVLIQAAQDAYEVYWNGKLIGRYGKLPPHAWWYYSQFARSFPLTGSGAGVLAIRVWKAPLDAFDPAESGGVYLPFVGDAATISLGVDESEWQIIGGDLFDYGLIDLRVFIAFLCLVLWYRNRKEFLFVWVAVYTAAPVAIDILNRLFRIPLPWTAARALNQPIYVLFHISLWFLLLWLLRLHDNVTLVRWTRGVAYAAMAAGIADGILALFWARATLWMQWTDGVLDGVILVTEVFPFALIYLGLRQKLDPSRWAVALSALLLQLIDTATAGSALGQRFTHWTLFNFINNPLFTIQKVHFYPDKVASLLLFAAILYAVYRYALEQAARQSVMEREIDSAREVQRVLVPAKLPALEGFAVTSAYQPAMEVGGDFFQIIPNPGGSTMVALGDVSGKGLKAGMSVSMIVGVLRAEAATTSPRELLGRLNRCLVGRMGGGFATGMAFRVDRDGTVTFANAGHLPPYLNGEEYTLDGSLPLGLTAKSDYPETKVKMEPGDQLSVYTDGLLEAKSATGELFGFERMHALFRSRPTAQEAMKAAIDFGQDDDITVLTFTRLAAGVESTTSVSAPVLAAGSTNA